MIKIFIATPAHNDLVNTFYATSLADTCVILKDKGIQVMHGVISGGSMLVMERNRIFKSFLESDCTHIFCVDADIGWKGVDVAKMISYKKDFIAALYPSRTNEGFFFRGFVNPNNTLKLSPEGLLKVSACPAGFMIIARSVLTKIMEKHPENKFQANINNFTHEIGYCFFNTPIINNVFWGEDFAFCEMVNELGIDIWIDTEIEINHAGRKGIFAKYLHEKNQELAKLG